ncbi:hypothetical protein K470DRAFT_255239 [Piedraia hortae CBS 480.64]|uniref:Uncharacterized protein n=1 Tax=Piedraia hortae CBS 480.64 TaxID=1314780 RepID=A0A6A7C6I1_9PEZI|nr:hypothetical protein K470DRAFT_255239 [Piedraia hortae CBS 480.64]
MGKIQKKNAKARLDSYYYKAKEKGYRARAAFKLINLNKKYGFLEWSKCLIDLCAAPGSWLQVAAETMPTNSLIVGVDLAPIKPIPRAITFQGDITTAKCRATIRGHLKTWKADTVIHDGAPNVGTAWVQDAFSQNELVLSSLKLATEFLVPGGTFVTKVFRSKDSAKLEWIFKQLFARVDQTKPPSSRNVSAETFYVCREYKAPKQLDPRFLDPKHAFAEVEAAAVNHEAKVFNPEKKKRKRDGYDDGDYTQFHEAPVSEFVKTQDPIKVLASLNKMHFRLDDKEDHVQAALAELPETTDEVRACCEDLKVLGRKEFKLLLRWRLKARELFGLRQKKTADKGTGGEEDAVGEEVAVVEPMDAEMKLQDDIQRMKDMQSKEKRKERKKENERKHKEIVRMQMGMITPTDIGIEAAVNGGDETTFRLKDVDKAGISRQIARGKMHHMVEPQRKDEEMEIDLEEDEELDALETQLDSIYDEFRERREDRDAKAKAKRARLEAKGEDHDETFEGFSDRESSEDELVEDEDDRDSSEDEQDVPLLNSLHKGNVPPGGLSGRAATFFQQDIFDDLDLDEPASESEDAVETRDSGVDVDSENSKAAEISSDSEASFEGFSDADSEIEEVHREPSEEDWESADDKPKKESRPNIDIITAEAMTIAHALATGKVTKAQLEDDSFNKYSLRSTEGLPDWFLDDEGKHSKPHRPITKEAAQAIRDKSRALNARPIKKVREAKARKIMRAARRLEKLKKKSEGLAEGDDRSEKDKAAGIAQLMAKAKKGTKKKPKVKVIKAGGANKGAGRPRGVKGKYKMVDPRLKKDVRAEKRLKKKMKRGHR